MISQSNRIGRDKEMIEDIYRLMEVIPNGTTISVQAKLRDDWSLVGYFQRYANISLDLKEPYSSKYVLVEKGFTNESLLEHEKNAVVLQRYDLYER